MPETTFPAVDIAAATATTPKLHRAVEDQAIEKYIRDAGRFLETRAQPHDHRRDAGRARVRRRGTFHRHGDAGGGRNGVLRPARGHPPERSGDDGRADRTRVDKAREDFEAFRLVARAVFPTCPTG